MTRSLTTSYPESIERSSFCEHRKGAYNETCFQQGSRGTRAIIFLGSCYKFQKLSYFQAVVI